MPCIDIINEQSIWLMLIIRGQTNIYLSGAIRLNVLCVFMFYVKKGNMVTRNKWPKKIQKDITMNINQKYGNEE